MRNEFASMTDVWTLISGMDDITYRIEEVAKWTIANGPLQPDEEKRIQLMIQTQIARGFYSESESDD